VVAAIESTLERGEGAFVVCPRIGGDDEDEGAGAIERHAELEARFGRQRVALAHGRLPAAELRRAIERFRAAEAGLLVGTTVVEVGIDVPHATLMVVDGAEAFGLSQLHQLRGRVGRASLISRCLLVHDEPTSELARRRLQALVELQSGAEIARRDLELRGAGELDGVRQSGDGELALLEDFSGAPWLERIEGDVVALTDGDPALEREPVLARFAERALARATLREQAA
jgi:ATP-dependent DNA helicase RecG